VSVADELTENGSCVFLCVCAFDVQVRENAKQDLKDGLALYNTDNNVGLRNAWNIIQAEVRDSAWLRHTHTHTHTHTRASPPS